MLKPPIYQVNYADGLGAVYTARYRPGDGRVTYYWPDESWEQSFDEFAPGTRTVTLGQNVQRPRRSDDTSKSYE
jgi:hypothetical protein